MNKEQIVYKALHSVDKTQSQEYQQGWSDAVNHMNDFYDVTEKGMMTITFCLNLDEDRLIAALKKGDEDEEK